MEESGDHRQTFAAWVHERLTLRSLLSVVTATLIVLGFVLFWGVVWIWSSWSESLSWVLWASLVAQAVFWTAYRRAVPDIQRRPLIETLLLALAVALWVGGGIGYEEWGSDRGPSGGVALLVVVFLMLPAAPVAVGATVLHSRLSMSLAAILLGQGLCVVLIIVLPAPEITRVYETERFEGEWVRLDETGQELDSGRNGTHTFLVDERISAQDRILIVAMGGVGAVVLVALGAALRRHVPIWVTLPAGLGFLLTAAIYQVWYPPMSNLGD